MRRAAFIVVAAASAALVLAGGCILISNSDIGDACEDTSDCDDPGLVCVLLDETQPGGARVCVPMKRIDEPVPCDADAECPAKGYPVDATCVDGACACAGDRFTFACDITVEVMDPLTCLCVTAPDDEPDAGTEDAGAGEPDAGNDAPDAG